MVQAVATLYSQLVGRPIDPMNEVLITSGAYEALYSTIQGHVEEGDEVVIIEPFFDCYDPMVKFAGGVPRYVPLRLVTFKQFPPRQYVYYVKFVQKNPPSDRDISSADFALDDAELESAFNERTKLIILNTPNNPLGKVFNR